MLNAEGSGLPVIAKQYLEDEAIIRETADQVIKDFRMYEANITFEASAGTPYQELFFQIKPFISEMMRSDASTLYSLLYTIDIPDHWWRHIRNEPDPEIVANTLTDLILRRELLKVLTRIKFRQARLESEIDPITQTE